MNGRGADALFAAMLADIAILAAIAEDHHRFALQRRFVGDFDRAESGVIKRCLPAIPEVFELLENEGAVGRIIDDEAGAIAECHQGDRVIRAQGVDVAAGGRQRFRQGLVRHAAAGIDDQDSRESQIVIGDVLNATDIGQAGQVAADREVIHRQAGDQLLAGIEDADVDGDL